MSILLEQPRKPQGTSDGGQFTSPVYSESMELLSNNIDVDAHNATGDWYVPPNPISAEQVLAFWENQEIPIHIRDQFLAKYDERWYRDYAANRAKYEADWRANFRAQQPPPERKLMEKESTYQARATAELAERENAAWETHLATLGDTNWAGYAGTIKEPNIEKAIKACRILNNAKDLENVYPEEWAKLMNHEITYYDGTKRTLKIVEEKNRFIGFDSWMRERPLPPEVVAMQGLRSDIQALNQTMAKVLEGVSSLDATVRSELTDVYNAIGQTTDAVKTADQNNWTINQEVRKDTTRIANNTGR